ncbi:hypothetical protein BKA93DRAFT_753968 [Sparassis latifolia]
MAGNGSVGASAPHQSNARFETTAAFVEAEASTAELTSEVGHNADQMHTAAETAAAHAQHKEPASAVDELEEGLSNTTNVAASQGWFDVQSAKAATAGYAEQAKNLANSAYQTAQQYVPDSQTTSQTMQSALDTGKEYLATAQSYVQPHLEKARDAVNGATGAGSGSVDTDRTTSV